jgi:hypothetical protein
MGLSEDIQKINDELNKLRKELGKNPLKPFDEKDLERAKEALMGLRSEIREMSSDLDYVSKSFKDSVNELSKQNTFLSDARNSLKGIANISNKVLEYRKGETTLSEKQLKTLQQQAKAKFTSLSNDIRSGQLGKENTREAQDALDKQDLFNSEIERTIIHQRQVNKEIGLLGTGIGGVTKLLSKMGFGDMSQSLQDAIDKTKNSRLQTKLNTDAIGSLNDEIKKGNTGNLSYKQILAGFGGKELKDLVNKKEALESQNKELESQTSKYKNIGRALKDQLTSFNLIDFVFKSIIEAFGTSQKGISDLARGLGMSASRATVMRQEFADIANSSMNANLTVKALQESQLAVGQALGTNAKLNKEDLETMTDIVKKTGLQHSELIGIEKLSLATGKSLDSNVKSALGGATAFASQNKLVVDNNKVLREVNKASSALKLSLGGSVEELGKAVVQAQKFGINLEQAESIASSMLDFESSIEAELSAELLTGKDINLEKARGLALEGKSAEAAAEILKQVGGTAEFSKMNVIQQEAMAKAVGLTRDQLADSLIEREALEAMSAKEGDTALQAYEKLKASGKTEKEIVEILGEKTAQQLEQQSSQDKFNASVEKLKEIFVQVMDAVAPIFDVLSSIAEVVMPAINFLLSPLIEGFSLIGGLVSSFVNGLKEGKAPAIALAAILGTIAAPLIASAIGAIFKSFAAIPFGIGIPLAGVAVAGLFSLLSKGESKAKQVSDAAIDPKGGLIVSGPKGTYQGDPNDTIIMGTGIGKGKGKTTPQQGGGGGGTVNIDMTQTNALLQQLINLIQTGGNVILDGQKVGTALKLGSFKTQ